MKEKFYAFAVVVAYILGSLGSLIYTVKAREWPIVLANVAIIAMAFPYFLRHWRILNP